ncbi:MAG: hypothetical protein PHF97_09270 [Bacteroidales bacterium]|nr:hypothetical protein [Bacteroidales bacterium]
MNDFDEHIRILKTRMDEMSHGRQKVRVIQAPASPDEIRVGIPFRIGDGAQQGIILREDTFAELGSPESGSCSMTLMTSDLSRIHDGRITLIGDDIGESQKELPLGRLVFIGGRNLMRKDYENLANSLIIGDRIEGYMERTTSQFVWCRISRNAGNRGFTMFSLGQALIALVKSTNPKIETVEVYFITTNKKDLSGFEEYALQVRKIARELIKDNWKIRGYEIDCESDCNTCDDKPICDDIREMLKEKKERESVILHKY